MAKILKLLVLCSLLAACSSDNYEHNQTAGEQQAAEQFRANEGGTAAQLANDVTLRCIVDKANVRASASTQARVIGTIQQGDRLRWHGQVSDSSLALKLRGVRYDEPWLEVELASGRKGWVYGGVVWVDETQANNLVLVEQLLAQRLKGIVGEGLGQEVLAWRKEYAAISSSEEMAKTFMGGQELRDELTPTLEAKAEVDHEHPANMNWLKSAMPGYEVAIVAEGTAYYLFADFRQWQEKAAQTPDQADDDFVALMQMLYPPDGVEHFFPVWFMQTWDYGGESLLGQGIHEKVLVRMDEVLSKSEVFAESIKALKDDLIEDIAGERTKFQYAAQQVLDELTRIIDTDYKVLDSLDKTRLIMKKQQLEVPTKIQFVN